MQHEEQDPRHHPNHWEHQQHRRHPDHPQHFQDFRSRWGEPMPPLPPYQDRYPDETELYARRQRYLQEEWLPEQRYERQSPDWERRPPRNEHPMAFQRDAHFEPGNQRVEDRWFEDPLMPHPRRRPPRHYDGFWQDYED